MRDPAIKLFGKEIPVPENGPHGDCSDEYEMPDHDRGAETAACLGDEKVNRTGEEEEKTGDVDKDQPAEKSSGSKLREHPKSLATEEPQNPATQPDSGRNPITPSRDEEDNEMPETDKKTENDPSDTSNTQKKPPKKSDKVVPCPRCGSTDTKFCYYNNYNVNQPRHFCRGCQRYWTAGGAMRNVPVGAGRRKSKNSAVNYPHITISQALHAPQFDSLKLNNGKILSFSPESPLCKSMVYPAEKQSPVNGTRNGFQRVEPTRDNLSGGSSFTNSSSVDVRLGTRAQQAGFRVPVPCLTGIPYPCPWNSAIPMLAYRPGGYPVPVYPTPCWNSSVPCPWNVSRLRQTTSSPSASLGKHSRDGKDLENKELLESSVLVPKTLRIHDPDEAAKSSIWATLGIKNSTCLTQKGVFEAFQPEGEGNVHAAKAPPAFQANPAALSRSLNFQESV
ncbi:hypothetical protein NMG60_11009630 [Bertholletia excelsa]